ncbi:GntR family transcriptional regulator [Leucothrix arctica]|uniref:GntR family transcriptional regulator n=1 Tax=Leucothrix arctica TaxID=1481894 RepID=A0A317CER6_9GAMM|nr:GntR family transcriptional regulator [Leucothrix arctica]
MEEKQVPELGQTLQVSDLLKDKSLDSNGSLTAQVFNILKELIITIKLHPGQMLSEKEVAESLQASKTPIREAMIRLQGSGLVEIIPKKGTFVTSIKIDRYIEACFIRLQLEVGAVRRAAEQRGNWNVSLKMDSLLLKQEQALKDKKDQLFFQLDEALHQAFFDAAGVSGVWKTLKDTQGDVYRMRYLKRLHNIRRESAVIEEHRAIVDAIKSGSPDDAEAAIVKHVGSLEGEVVELSSHADLLDFIETLNSGRFKHRA